MVHEAANYVKKCLGGGEDDAIIFCGSGSTAAIKTPPGSHGNRNSLNPQRKKPGRGGGDRLDHRGLIDMEELRRKLDFYKGRTARFLAPSLLVATSPEFVLTPAPLPAFSTRSEGSP
ncbi:hypothetical protein Salat_2496900, partial [Sesamum alatum]